jgi:hypothetical protein
MLEQHPGALMLWNYGRSLRDPGVHWCTQMTEGTDNSSTGFETSGQTRLGGRMLLLTFAPLGASKGLLLWLLTWLPYSSLTDLHCGDRAQPSFLSSELRPEPLGPGPLIQVSPGWLAGSLPITRCLLEATWDSCCRWHHQASGRESWHSLCVWWSGMFSAHQ